MVKANVAGDPSAATTHAALGINQATLVFSGRRTECRDPNRSRFLVCH
jgi:hypothetical protein